MAKKSKFPEHAAALNSLYMAISLRDLPRLEAAAPLVDWEAFRDMDANSTRTFSGTPLEFSILRRLSTKAPEIAPDDLPALRKFAPRALRALAKAGYHVLDDTYVLDMFTLDPPLTRVVATLAAKQGLRDEHGGTVLHLALGYGTPDLRVVQLAVAQGTDVNAQSAAGKTALQRMWEENDYAPYIDGPAILLWEQSMQRLLSAGAREDIPDKSGATALSAMEDALDPNGRNAGGLAASAQQLWAARQAILDLRGLSVLEGQVAPAAAVRGPRM